MQQKTEQEKAIELIRKSPAHQVSELLVEILKEENRRAGMVTELCVNAHFAYQRFAELRAKGWGYESAHKEVITCLEELAQTCEKRLGRHRYLFDLIRRDMQIDDESRPGYFPPAATFGEPIKLSYEQHPPLLRVEMEGLLPYSLDKGACYLHEKLSLNLDRFYKQWKDLHGEKILLSPAVVAFVHHFERTKQMLNYTRDYDSLERKCIINALQSSHILSDSPKAMVDMNMAVQEDRTFTEILVTRVAHLPQLLERLDFALYQ